jgi:dTDP-4-dehydrorhamnose reductase
MSNKIFIFGSNGMLGKYVSSYLKNKNFSVIELTRIDYDLNDISIKNMSLFIDNINVCSEDIVINCAGVIPQASKNKIISKHMYYKINAMFPVILSMILMKKNIHFIHVTTDCVFSGDKGKYNELDTHDAFDDYGVSKSLGELCYGTIIRTSIIGEEMENKRSLLEWIISNKNKCINGFINHYWNGVSCLQLAKIIYQIICNNQYWIGIKHIFSPNVVNKYDLCNMINETYNLNIQIHKQNTENINKSLTSVYKCDFNIPCIEQQIKELYEYVM